jgi:hypothetical protein
MNRSIALLNIEHFRRLLANETDSAKRELLLRLLEEEEAKLPAPRRRAAVARSLSQ